MAMRRRAARLRASAVCESSVPKLRKASLSNDESCIPDSDQSFTLASSDS